MIMSMTESMYLHKTRNIARNSKMIYVAIVPYYGNNN